MRTKTRELSVLTLLLLGVGCSSSNFDLASVEWDDASRSESSAETTSNDAVASEAIASEASPADTGVDTSSSPDSDASDASDTAKPDTYVTPDTFVTDTYVAPDADAASIEVDPPDTSVRCTTIAGCIDNSNQGYGCDTPKQIGRRQAKGAGYSWSAEHFSTVPVSPITDGASGCPALGPDRAYSIFMRRGETVTVTLSTTSWSSGTYQSMFWESHSCSTNVCAGSYFQCGSAAGTTPTSSSHIATSDGWVTILIAGRTATDVGYYDLKVTLSGCVDSLCECG